MVNGEHLGHLYICLSIMLLNVKIDESRIKVIIIFKKLQQDTSA